MSERENGNQPPASPPTGVGDVAVEAVDEPTTDPEADTVDAAADPTSEPAPVGEAPSEPPSDDGIETIAASPGEPLHHVALPHELSPIARFDTQASALFDRWRGREPYDRIFYAATELGDFGLIWLLTGSVKALRSDRDIQAAIRLFTLLGIESVVINGMVKSLFKRERPVIQEERPYRIRIPLTTSFPSGHASSAMLAAQLLAEDSRIAPAYYAAGLLVAASRVYVKIHHPSDVIGGLAVGTVLGIIARKTWKLPPKQAAPARRGLRRRR